MTPLLKLQQDARESTVAFLDKYTGYGDYSEFGAYTFDEKELLEREQSLVLKSYNAGRSEMREEDRAIVSRLIEVPNHRADGCFLCTQHAILSSFLTLLDEAGKEN